MSSPTCLLAIDQGTTSTRVIVWNSQGRNLGSAALELRQYYPKPGWVEHDPEEIWSALAGIVPEALTQAKVKPSDIAAIGVTNQRETVLFWDRST
ncbi:MAG TPA: FGGY family carbohydrate kinase, partial [Gemmataceae bacterium]|nr:FGGY family carbohydrate kinase [Gemmataceae bacterium]